MYLSLFEHANTRKHVYEHSCSSVRVFSSIPAHLAHLAQSFSLILNAINKKKDGFISEHANTESMSSSIAGHLCK